MALCLVIHPRIFLAWNPFWVWRAQKALRFVTNVACDTSWILSASSVFFIYGSSMSRILTFPCLRGTILLVLFKWPCCWLTVCIYFNKLSVSLPLSSSLNYHLERSTFGFTYSRGAWFPPCLVCPLPPTSYLLWAGSPWACCLPSVSLLLRGNLFSLFSR